MVVRQERKDTTLTRTVIDHRGMDAVYVLNTAQMRDAQHLQQLRMRTPPYNEEATMFQSAETLLGQRIKNIRAKKAAARGLTTDSSATTIRQSDSGITQSRRPEDRRLETLRGNR